jgi:hypothetical protein
MTIGMWLIRRLEFKCLDPQYHVDRDRRAPRHSDESREVVYESRADVRVVRT